MFNLLALLGVLAGLAIMGCSAGASGVLSEPDATATTAAGPATEAPPHERGTVTIGAVGDLMFARDITSLMEQHGVSYPFDRVKGLFGGTDLLIGNLEGTFTARGMPLVKKYTFRTPPDLATVLQAAGFNAVTLGNNHAFDFGAVGLLDTFETLRGIGMPWFGAGPDEAAARAPLILQARGQRVAFLGYSGVDESGFASDGTPGVARASVETIQADVREARSKADYVVVVIHAGIEYTHEPSAWQRELAHAAIDAGADVVIGHHPHVLQPLERYRDGLILYSLGNFVFDLDPDDLATMGSGPFETVVAVLTLSREAPPEVAFRPVFIDPVENRPRQATADEAADILDVLQGPGAE
jgi:poly-gamma-glutamate synthesis protein (capsule biosynthesis protein)